MADNTTVELSNSTFKNKDGSISHFVTTSHDNAMESGLAYLSIDKKLYDSALLSHDHSHPGGPSFPSGLPGSRYTKGGDIPFAKGYTSDAISKLQPIPQFRIYVPGNGYRRYHINSTQNGFNRMPKYYWKK
ncbi:hypothetical protein M2451_003553 [Dysgonomonas sp. PFB1-18]|nr:hypothetical protein [Dysgonomonas sp. PF1-14]MDH6340531.1 hypothetical protein [Dysgonomonas sp. PF1-16]MDH6382213.1 hypothetical protein [Dysgonomonas sp. PFB1-18]